MKYNHTTQSWSIQAKNILNKEITLTEEHDLPIKGIAHSLKMAEILSDSYHHLYILYERVVYYIEVDLTNVKRPFTKKEYYKNTPIRDLIPFQLADANRRGLINLYPKFITVLD